MNADQQQKWRPYIWIESVSGPVGAHVAGCNYCRWTQRVTHRNALARHSRAFGAATAHVRACHPEKLDLATKEPTR